MDAIPLPAFRSPANQAARDLADYPTALTAFAALWNAYLDAISQQAIVGNPWQASNSANTPYYFNPLTTVIPTDAPTKPVQWSAMPGRIAYYDQADWDSELSLTQINQLADYGWTPSPSAAGRQTFPNLTTDPCSGDPDVKAYGPYGPRGWQDEYCEWSVVRDPTTNKIVRIDFTCENPEYWYTLWRVAPDVVLDLYRATLDNQAIQLSDLWLKDAGGNPVLDPSTGDPAYDPLNIWNRGTERTAASGGAMHLTSTPNTLQTELAGLAGAATIQRSSHPGGAEQLLCCAQFGQPHRNSDPHIGFVVNQVVGTNKKITIADPPGLYMQMPSFSQYALPSNAPAGAKAQDYWRVVRGAMSLNDMYGNPLPGNFILHAVFEVPAELGFTVGDITIGGATIDYAAQVAATFFMQINATAIPVNPPLNQQGCAGDAPTPSPQPLQMWHTALWNAYYGTAAPVNPVGHPMVLASNTVILPPTVGRGTQAVPMSLVCRGASVGPNGELPTVGFDGPDGNVTAVVTGLVDNVTYTVPGDSYPSTNQVLSIDVTIAAGAAPGLRGVRVGNHGEAAGQAAPGFLWIE
ncbi:hypothetical protein BLA18110_01718 [Burkholderia lata]|uniref:hypothetical protein n=1 Tax=Burkholderia lata (strain ATCC 17760 / DSM 23089 / LMG 22485 / NCIMB 9086 / R18194 / 383) TaxID=482957 RepID=UPI0014536195|nr:hypothetical protein [Burkholderia lata]VWC67522.1 hypothetical protein BLA18110_01718 [Burkholderia lata]